MLDEMDHTESWDYVKVSANQYADIRKHFNTRGFWTVSIIDDNDELVEHLGCVEEIDRDEDRMYFDYLIRREFFDKFLEETGEKE